jgi:hypothetical protein
MLTGSCGWLMEGGWRDRKMKSFLKRYRFTILGLIFGLFLVFFFSLSNIIHFPRSLREFVTGMHLGASFVPGLLSISITRLFSCSIYPDFFFTPRLGQLSLVLLYWILVGFLIDKLRLAGRSGLVKILVLISVVQLLIIGIFGWYTTPSF